MLLIFGGDPSNNLAKKTSLLITSWAQSQNCIDAMDKNEVDLAVMDPVSMFVYQQNHGDKAADVLKIVVAEVHGTFVDQSCGESCNNDVYAVAIASATTCQKYENSLTLNETRSWHSCHGQYGDLTGARNCFSLTVV